MTKNQIEYQKVQEQKRANRENESLTYTRDLASRQLGIDTLRETARHNQQVEFQARDNLAEQYRNNVAQLAELQRSHLAAEGIQKQEADTHAFQASETERHNKASEDISSLNAQISKYAADVGASSRTNAAGISAVASQYASDNALLARQLEIDLNRYGIDVNAIMRSSEINETKRANQVRENETKRSNKATEAIKGATVVETYRHDLATELQKVFDRAADVHLRQQQVNVAQQQANTQSRAVDANISLVPSQKFENYSRGASAIGSAANSLIGVVSKLKGG